MHTWLSCKTARFVPVGSCHFLSPKWASVVGCPQEARVTAVPYSYSGTIASDCYSMVDIFKPHNDNSLANMNYLKYWVGTHLKLWILGYCMFILVFIQLSRHPPYIVNIRVLHFYSRFYPVYYPQRVCHRLVLCVFGKFCQLPISRNEHI